MVFMPQWDFLNFLAEKAQELPGFSLRMGHGVSGLLRENGRIHGVIWQDTSGAKGEIRAPLVIGADGRHSVVRTKAGLEVQDFGSAVDVLWLRLTRLPDDPVPAMSHAGPQQGLVLIDRGDFWQCGYVIRKGSFDDLKARGLPAFRAALAALAPLPAGRFDEIQGWDQVHLLSIRMDRLKRWWAPGCCASAMRHMPCRRSGVRRQPCHSGRGGGGKYPCPPFARGAVAGCRSGPGRGPPPFPDQGHAGIAAHDASQA
ncbi:FAD-dependent monooxygenase [Paracoccus kondratievae]